MANCYVKNLLTHLYCNFQTLYTPHSAKMWKVLILFESYIRNNTFKVLLTDFIIRFTLYPFFLPPFMEYSLEIKDQIEFKSIFFPIKVYFDVSL